MRRGVELVAAAVFCLSVAQAQSGQQKATGAGNETTSYTETYAGLNLEIVWIPGGTFQMGSRLSPEDMVKRYHGKAGDEKYFTDDHPVHTVTLDGFWMGKFEVTNAQFRKFRPGHSSNTRHDYDLDADTQPVVNVSWNDAKAFCDWLSEKTGTSYTLPTEAQWEYTCRAGTESDRYRGDDDETMGQSADTSSGVGRDLIREWLEKNNVRSNDFSLEKGTAPVGSFKPNKFGLYDMLGNVAEWTADWFSPYPGGPQKTLYGEDSKVVRGGAWDYLVNSPTCSKRLAANPRIRSNYFGFRCAQSLPPAR